MTTYNVSASVTRHDGSLLGAAWECWLGASEIATQVTATVWGWYHQAFFSAEAQRRYQWIGEMIACLGMAVYLAGVFTRRWVQPRIDAFVDSCQAPEVDPAPQPEESPPAVTPVVSLVETPVEPLVETPVVSEAVTPDLSTLGIRELRLLGRDSGIKGASRMRKADLLALLTV